MAVPERCFSRAFLLIFLFSPFVFSAPMEQDQELYSSPAHQDPATSPFKKVVDLLGTVSWVEASFTEQKEMGLLTQPLLSSGRMVFSPDHGLYRQTTQPLAMELIINRNEFIQRDANGEVSKMAVGRLPPAKAFIDLFLAILSGDERRWEKHFEVFFHGTTDHWQIGFLTKPNSPVSRGLQRIVISGEGPRFVTVKTVEKNGDQTTTHYTDHRVLLKGDKENSTLPPFPRISSNP